MSVVFNNELKKMMELSVLACSHDEQHDFVVLKGILEEFNDQDPSDPQTRHEKPKMLYKFSKSRY